VATQQDEVMNEVETKAAVTRGAATAITTAGGLFNRMKIRTKLDTSKNRAFDGREADLPSGMV